MSYDEQLQAIEKIHDDWVAAEIAGRPEDVLALCAPAFVGLSPAGDEIRGRKALAGLLKRSLSGVRSIDSSNLLIHIYEDMAVMSANFTTQKDGEDHPIRGRHLWILNWLDGEWKVVLSSWGLDEAAG